MVVTRVMVFSRVIVLAQEVLKGEEVQKNSSFFQKCFGRKISFQKIWSQFFGISPDSFRFSFWNFPDFLKLFGFLAEKFQINSFFMDFFVFYVFRFPLKKKKKKKDQWSSAWRIWRTKPEVGAKGVPRLLVLTPRIRDSSVTEKPG